MKKLAVVFMLIVAGSVFVASPAWAGLELKGESLAGSVQIVFGRHRDYYAPPPPPPESHHEAPPRHHMHMPPPPPQAHHEDAHYFHDDYARRDMWARRPAPGGPGGPGRAEPPRGYMPPPPPRRYR